MNRKIIVTKDNSKTLLISSINETYHSTNGALNEANHVFIAAGLKNFSTKKSITVFELGFGTGLNALVACEFAIKNNIAITYISIEKYPVETEIAMEMEYPQLIKEIDLTNEFEKMHKCEWNNMVNIVPNFKFKKIHNAIEDVKLESNFFDIVFFDAFSPSTQPELWNETILSKMYATLKENGILVTYCAQGKFKRNLKKIGFKVENIPGPIGKREMTRAIKNINKE